MKIVKCRLFDMLVYDEDAISTPSGYISKFAMWDCLDSRYKALQKRNVLNLFCYLLPIILFIAWCVITELPYNAVLGIIAMICQYGGIGLVIYASIRWLKAKDMFQDIGDPEDLLIKSKGTIDLQTGHVSVSTSSEDVYSDRQIMDIVMNVIKFIIVFVGIYALGWLYWIIYMIRKAVVKKRVKKLKEEISHGESVEYTLTAINIMSADYDKLNNKLQVVKDSDGEYENFTMEFIDTFIYGGNIYGLFGNSDNKRLLIKVVPGYNTRIVETDEDFNDVYAGYKQLLEE